MSGEVTVTKPAWLQELEERIARLTAETEAVMAATCAALKQTYWLLNGSHEAEAALQAGVHSPPPSGS
jgi:hypothetical protein